VSESFFSIAARRKPRINAKHQQADTKTSPYAVQAYECGAYSCSSSPESTPTRLGWMCTFDLREKADRVRVMKPVRRRQCGRGAAFWGRAAQSGITAAAVCGWGP
jgi:hypothetical protein